MSEYKDLQEYVGKEYNDEIKSEIEKKFEPFTILLCTMEHTYKKKYYNNKIRCVVEDGMIRYLGFH